MKPTQPDITWSDPEPFQLVAQATRDGERITNEQQQRDDDRKTAEGNQIPLFT